MLHTLAATALITLLSPSTDGGDVLRDLVQVADALLVQDGSKSELVCVELAPWTLLRSLPPHLTVPGSRIPPCRE